MPDITSPEYLGALSTVGAWRAVLRNPYKPGTSHHHRWQAAREEALGKKYSNFRNLTVRDRQIDPAHYIYDTDKGAA
jgi:hypothetical protein